MTTASFIQPGGTAACHLAAACQGRGAAPWSPWNPVGLTSASETAEQVLTLDKPVCVVAAAAAAVVSALTLLPSTQERACANCYQLCHMVPAN